MIAPSVVDIICSAEVRDDDKSRGGVAVFERGLVTHSSVGDRPFRQIQHRHGTIKQSDMNTEVRLAPFSKRLSPFVLVFIRPPSKTSREPRTQSSSPVRLF